MVLIVVIVVIAAPVSFMELPALLVVIVVGVVP
jgi:hypothetical protein